MKTNISVLLLALLAIGCTSVSPGNDPLVVRAETFTEAAVATVDAFVKYEYENRAVMPVEAQRAAQVLRWQFPQAIENLRLATKHYKYSSDRSSGDAVIFALSEVTELVKRVEEAWKYYKP